MALIIQPMSLPILHKLSQDFVLLVEKGGVYAYHIATGSRMTRDGLVTYSGKHYGNVEMMDTSNNQIVSKNSGNIWWDWDHVSRRVVREVVMCPTNEPEDPHSDILNRWYVLKKEMAIPDPNATMASIQPLVDHLLYISDNDYKGVFYFLCWLAELWRNPDVKIPTAIMLYSKNGRVGKSMLAELLAYVFGESMVKSIAGSKLYANFDDAMDGQRIIVLNELSRADKADRYETFKSLISEIKMEFEGKGKGSNYRRNCLHWIITTNNADCIPMMAGDGRILVLRCEATRRDDDYYKRLADWMEFDGPELLAGCFARWPFPDDWDPKAPVPQTEATVLTQVESRSGLTVFIDELVQNARPPFDKDIGRCTALIEQLSMMYPANMKAYRLNNRTLPSSLRELGYKQIQMGYETSKGTRVSTPVWCWRNYETWLNTAVDIAQYLGE